MSATMKAVVLHDTRGPQCLSLDHLPVPSPGPGEVRIALRAAAINRRDVWISLKQYMDIRLPCIMGADGAGVIEATGAGVEPRLAGREVVIYPAFGWGDDARAAAPDFRVLGMPQPGTFAEYICVPADHCLPKPAHLDWRQAAALPLCGLTGWRALMTQGAAAAGGRVLVTGIGGGVATTVLLLAARLGAEVWVTSGKPDKIERAVALGARGGVSYRDAGWAQALLERAGPMDVIVDGSGGPDFNRCLQVLARGGRYVVYGATAGNPPTPPDLFQLFLRQQHLCGSTMGSPAEFAAMLAFVERHRIVPVVDRVYPLEEAVAAHEHVQATHQMGKVVFDIGH